MSDGACCYCLVSACGRRTYVGKTTDFRRRLRQHNGEIVGGARTTRRSRPWRPVWRVCGFRSDTDALRFEWRMHHPPVRRRGVAGRAKCLDDVLALRQFAAMSYLHVQKYE